MIVQGKVWGHTCPIFNKNNVEVHQIFAKCGGYCSKHLHKSKYNRFVVFSGKLKITIWKDYGTEDITILETGMECTVPPGDYHRFEALEDTYALEIYWVDLRENDIVRYDHGGIRKNETAPGLCSETKSDGRTKRERLAILHDFCNHPTCSGIYCEQRDPTL